MKKAPRWLLVAQFLLMTIAMVLLATSLLRGLVSVGLLFESASPSSSSSSARVGSRGAIRMVWQFRLPTEPMARKGRRVASHDQPTRHIMKRRGTPSEPRTLRYGLRARSIHSTVRPASR